MSILFAFSFFVILVWYFLQFGSTRSIQQAIKEGWSRPFPGRADGRKGCPALRGDR